VSPEPLRAEGFPGMRRKGATHQGQAPEEPVVEVSADGAAGAETAPGAAAAPPTARAEEGDRLAALEAELADARDRWLRAVAEADNVRRRAARDAEDARRYAAEKLVSELLPVLDNLQRALEATEQTATFDALKGGVELIHRQFGEVLARAGVERIEALGQPFDPNLHEAIMQVEPEEGQEPHQVVEEIRAGYRLFDRVIRPTLVKVTSG